jgi:flagellar biosynthesis/type III secretory pathway protein FliH
MSTTVESIARVEELVAAEDRRKIAREAARLWIAYLAIPYTTAEAEAQKAARRRFNAYCKEHGLTLGEATGHEVNAEVFRQATYLMQSSICQLRRALEGVRTYAEGTLEAARKGEL